MESGTSLTALWKFLRPPQSAGYNVLIFVLASSEREARHLVAATEMPGKDRVLPEAVEIAALGANARAQLAALGGQLRCKELSGQILFSGVASDVEGMIAVLIEDRPRDVLGATKVMGDCSNPFEMRRGEAVRFKVRFGRGDIEIRRYPRI